jgi:hypothetical protein
VWFDRGECVVGCAVRCVVEQILDFSVHFPLPPFGRVQWCVAALVRSSPLAPSSLGAEPGGLTARQSIDATRKANPHHSGVWTERTAGLGKTDGPLTTFPKEQTMTTTPTLMTRPERLIVVADHTPGVHQADSEQFAWWLPVIGPTASALAFTLARHARCGDTTWDTTVLARTIGLAGNRSKLWASLERLTTFGCAHFASVDVFTIRLYLPALTPRQAAALPDNLAAAYRIVCPA